MFLLLAVIMVGVTSCNSLENKAKEQLKETIGDVMKNPDTFKMRNEKTIISNDSLFVMTFSGIGENSYGGHSNQKYEYVFIKNKPKDEDEITNIVNNVIVTFTMNTPNITFGLDNSFLRNAVWKMAYKTH